MEENITTKAIKNNIKRKNTLSPRTSKMHRITSVIIACALGISAGILSYSQSLYTADEYVTNYIYTYNPFTKGDERITLITIDEDTINEYGDFAEWDRSLLAEAVNVLSENNAAAIALDLDLSEEGSTEGDTALVEACETAGNVIAVADASFEGESEPSNANNGGNNDSNKIDSNDIDSDNINLDEANTSDKANNSTNDISNNTKKTNNTSSDSNNANNTNSTNSTLNDSNNANNTSSDTNSTNKTSNNTNIAGSDDIKNSNDNMHLANPADASMDWKNDSATEMSFPFAALRAVVSVGVSNAMQQSQDGTIRTAALKVNYDDKELSSFAALVYSTYQSSQGLSTDYPELDNDNLFGFNTVLNIDSYNIISFKDLLNGNFTEDDFSDKIALIGELSSSDENTSYIKFMKSDYSKQDVTMQASIIQTLLNNTIKIDVDKLFSAILYAVIICLVYLIFASRRLLFSALFYSGAFVGIIAGSDLLYQKAGYRFLLLIPLMYCIISIICNLSQNLIYASWEKYKMEKMLKLYVDSHVVDQITDIAPFELASVSTRRNIAVLFVDIRGFTSISESLDPEEVVKVLNDYFSVVYASVMAWNGTLDKFIGDAAMAIFNAPQDLDDYVFNAACAATDIMNGFEPIREEFSKKYNQDINLGIGINCGDAIVGNIGCLGRFDYTAIGDTVNTASRLESKAKPGEILISSSVHEILSERAELSSIGQLSLKGKREAVETFRIESINKPQAPNEFARKGFLHEINLLHTKVGSNIQLP